MNDLKHKFNYVSYLWDENKAASFGNDEVALLLYRSNLLGSDLRITNYGGGNTSCKLFSTDPLTGDEVEVMWIKGSGGDLGTLKKEGLSVLYLERLHSLEKRYRGIQYEDEMVELFNHAIYDFTSKDPSIDTPLHAFLPFKHIDHLHPDACIAIAASKDGEKITHDLFNGEIAWIKWQRPGFDLGLQLKKTISQNPKLKGIMLGSHGLFTWGDSSYECYLNSLDIIEKSAQYIEDNIGKKRPVFGGEKIKTFPKEERIKRAVNIAPVLRGFCSTNTKMIGHFTDDERVLEFINSHDLEKLAPMGTSCPDHFLRTKIAPLILSIPEDFDLKNNPGLKEIIKPLFEKYRKGYSNYYEKYKNAGSPAIRDSNPVVILYPGIGMFTFAKNKQTAKVASEFYINAINVMKGAEAISSYVSLPMQEAFNIEYWLLEEAKLLRMPKPKPLTGKIALITGSAGGIGKAIAKKFAEEGACVVLTDVNEERLNSTKEKFTNWFGENNTTAVLLDVTNIKSIEVAYKTATLAFGGVDIIVNNAGISTSKSILEHSEKDWDQLYDVLVKGQFFVSQSGIKVMRQQGMGGDIINIVSKNSMVAGPNNSGYGSAKAAQAHLSRLMAAELGEDKIKVNTVNPDAVIYDSNIWANGWAEGRAKAYGITVQQLPEFYAKRTLLNEKILPEDIANACFAFVGGLLNKSTGNILNVDGGISNAFVR